jgi:hypothetical protein
MEVGAVVAVVAVAVGGFAGRLTSGDGENSSDLSVRLLSMTTESSSQVHGFPQWWSDGESLVRFGAAQEGLTLSPLEPDWSVDLPDPRRLLAESDGIKAMASKRWRWPLVPVAAGRTGWPSELLTSR